MKYRFFLLLLLPLVTLSQTDFEKAEKLFLQQKFSLAQPLLENNLRKNPKHIKTIEYLGDIQSFSKNWEAAVGFYKQLRTANPREANFQYKYGGAMAMVAKDCNRFMALTMVSEIESAFLKAIQCDPKHIDARWALVELYLQLPGIFGGSESKANRYANELSKLSPVDGHLARGRIAEYFERYTAAEKHYRNAIETGHSKTTYQKLANLYKNKLNQPEKARLLLLEFSEKNKS